MHTKGQASEELRKKLKLDTCIYLGNDLNDITMFSNALDYNDFIVIANNEKREITEMLIEYLQEECKIKGIEWEDARLLVLEDENVNNFLHRTSKILGVLNSKRKPNTQSINNYRPDDNKQISSKDYTSRPKTNRRKKRTEYFIRELKSIDYYTLFFCLNK